MFLCPFIVPIVRQNNPPAHQPVLLPRQIPLILQFVIRGFSFGRPGVYLQTTFILATRTNLLQRALSNHLATIPITSLRDITISAVSPADHLRAKYKLVTIAAAFREWKSAREWHAHHHGSKVV